MNKKVPRHPEIRTMAAFVDGTLAPVELPSVTEHLRECPDCRTVVALLLYLKLGLPGVIGVMGFSTLVVALISCYLLPETVIKRLIRTLLELAYRVEIHPTQPQVAVKIPEVSRNDTQSRQFISVPRGNRFATLISAKRTSLDSELVFNIEGLPQGLTMSAGTG